MGREKWFFSEGAEEVRTEVGLWNFKRRGRGEEGTESIRKVVEGGNFSLGEFRIVPSGRVTRRVFIRLEMVERVPIPRLERRRSRRRSPFLLQGCC